MMKRSNISITFGPEDHPDTELFKRNLPFVVKISIGWHKVAKTLIDSGASLNLMMRKTFIEMGLNLADMTPSSGLSLGSRPLPSGALTWMSLVECGTTSLREMLTFEVASFDIGYTCILGRPFLLKFIAVVQTAYAIIKMPGPKGIITLNSNQHDTQVAEEQSAKMAKTPDDNT
jgi:hypothetical protein